MKPIELLVADNNARDIFLIHQALAEEPYPINISVASDGRQACQMLATKKFHPDLVILELDLPKLSGLSVLECTDPYVPVVVFTSLSNATDRRMAMDLGVVEYVEKPADPNEFIEAASRIFKQWTAVAAPRVE